MHLRGFSFSGSRFFCGASLPPQAYLSQLMSRCNWRESKRLLVFVVPQLSPLKTFAFGGRWSERSPRTPPPASLQISDLLSVSGVRASFLRSFSATKDEALPTSALGAIFYLRKTNSRACRVSSCFDPRTLPRFVLRKSLLSCRSRSGSSPWCSFRRVIPSGNRAGTPRSLVLPSKRRCVVVRKAGSP